MLLILLPKSLAVAEKCWRLWQVFYEHVWFLPCSCAATHSTAARPTGSDSLHMAGVALQIVKDKQEFERVEVSREEALNMFAENKFKSEIIQGLPSDATISLYRCGPMVMAPCSYDYYSTLEHCRQVPVMPVLCP